MKRILFVLVFLMIGILAGCATSDEVALYGDGGMTSTDDVSETEEVTLHDGAITITSDGTYTYTEDGIVFTIGDDEITLNTLPDITSGLLTASEFSDLENYDYYLSLFETNQDNEPGIFSEYIDNGYENMLQMVTVHVANGDTLLNGVTIELLNADQEVRYTAMSNVFGNAYLFLQEDASEITSIKVTYGENTKTSPYTYSDETDYVDIAFDVDNTHLDIIELMFVIDTTGSMSDEIAYLKVEVAYVIDEVSNIYPNSTIKLALLFYRDEGDTYVTRYFDFTEDIDAQQDNLSAQSANGGGDFPEAVSIALDEAVNKQWSTGNTTKLLFHVLDAPPHNNQEAMTRYLEALHTASEKGIRVIPIASSGIDKYTEYLLRNEAMMTGGTYVYLTNNSGIGGDHIDASTPDVEVELLNFLMIRLIVEFHTGELLEIVPYSNQE